MATRRKFWGWGYGGSAPERGAAQRDRARIVGALRHDVAEPVNPPRIEEITLRAPRLTPPAALAAICSPSRTIAPGHTYGKSFRDVVRASRATSRTRPTSSRSRATEADVVALLDWCAAGARRRDPVRRRLERRRRRRGAAAASATPASSRSISRRLDRVLEIDRTSRAARIQAGVLGPALEDQLRPHGLTLRHFPQSFEFSTLGGWIATRSGGHYATLYTHIDDFVESLRVVTPSGVVETRRLPGSGAGPEPRPPVHRLRGHPRRHHRGLDAPAGPADASAPSASVTFADLRRGARGRARASRRRASTRPTAACSTPARRMNAGAGDGSAAVLLVGLRVRRPSARRLDGPRARVRARSRRRGSRRTPARHADGRRRRARRRRRRLAQRVPRRAVPARRARRHRHDQRDLRDRDHLGSLRRASTPP